MKNYKKMMTLDIEKRKIQLCVTEMGHGDLLFFVHGWGHSLERWFPLMSRLRYQYKVVGLDLPGFGDTPPLDEMAVSISGYAKILKTLIAFYTDNYREKYSIVAHSLGGLISLLTCNDSRTRPENLLLIAVPSHGFKGIPKIIRKRFFLKAIIDTRNYFPGIIKRSIIRLLSFPTFYKKEYIDNLLVADVLKMDGETAVKMLEEIDNFPRNYLGNEVHAGKILLIRGKQDQIVKAYSPEMLARQLNAPYIEIADAGHTIMTEQHSTLLQLIRQVL